MHWINTSLNNTKIPEVITAKCFHKGHNNKQFIPRVYMLINHKMTHRYIYFRFTRHALQLHHVTMLNRIEYVYLSIKDAHDRQYNYMKITIFTLIGMIRLIGFNIRWITYMATNVCVVKTLLTAKRKSNCHFSSNI